MAVTDPAFEPEKLLADAGMRFHEVMRARREKDVEALRARTGPDLGAKWERKVRKSGIGPTGSGTAWATCSMRAS